jgi:hypothetical protein
MSIVGRIEAGVVSEKQGSKRLTPPQRLPVPQKRVEISA